MDIVREVAGKGGVARRRELEKAGFSGHEILKAVQDGRLSRPIRGVYVTPDADPALLAAACVKAELACVNAAERLGLWILTKPRFIHVCVDHGRPLEGNFRVHRSAKQLTPLDICLQCMRCLPELEALCVVESAVVKRLVTLQQLRSRTGGARDRKLRRIVGMIDPHSQSILETAARYRLKAGGFSVQTQVYVKGVGRLDLFVEGILGIEADGREHHTNAKEFEEDRRRGNVLMLNGTPVLRATYQLIVDRPEEFVELVRRGIAKYRPTKVAG
ncbi:type IV toxin-antitoxin system AbiEi family antitoxin domain-containing protein [Arthrobacter sp.]|uniref:type IV toxin-antitoxin system AbiEi family antitoxin domain-containing protein n=1 Tax=Arthrobacter sp. TaxID=1667 RepID=UPI002810C067|nr:type IV toxin-antitoxin system AbiEi family antitoxin domain-containing protein [Arthrobacter sp.]